MRNTLTIMCSMTLSKVHLCDGNREVFNLPLTHFNPLETRNLPFCIYIFNYHIERKPLLVYHQNGVSDLENGKQEVRAGYNNIICLPALFYMI